MYKSTCKLTCCLVSLGFLLQTAFYTDKIVNNFHGQNRFQFHVAISDVQNFFLEALAVISGVIRAQPLPGHSMGTLRLRVASSLGPAQLSAAYSTEMEKQLGGSGGCSPRKF